TATVVYGIASVRNCANFRTSSAAASESVCASATMRRSQSWAMLAAAAAGAPLPVLGYARSRRGRRLARTRIGGRLVERPGGQLPRLPDVALGELVFALLGQLRGAGAPGHREGGDNEHGHGPAAHGESSLAEGI